MTGVDGFSTHLPYLVATVLKCHRLYPGLPILELGCGHYSTLVLRGMAFELGLQVESVSTDPIWAAKFPGVQVIMNWGGWTPTRQFGVIFVDSELLVKDRFTMLPMLSRWCKAVVFHDAVTLTKRGHKWAEMDPWFKQVTVYDELPNGTAVLWSK